MTNAKLDDALLVVRRHGSLGTGRESYDLTLSKYVSKFSIFCHCMPKV